MNSKTKDGQSGAGGARRASGPGPSSGAPGVSAARRREVKVVRSTITNYITEKNNAPLEQHDTDADASDGDIPINPEIMAQVEKCFSKLLPEIEGGRDKELTESISELGIVVEEQARQITDGLNEIKKHKAILKDLDKNDKDIKMQQQEIMQAMQDEIDKLHQAVDERASRGGLVP